MSQRGVKVSKEGMASWTAQDQSFALMLSMLNLLASGMVQYNRLKEAGEAGYAKRHAAGVLEDCLRIWPQADKLAEAANYMANDLGFIVEVVAVAQDSSKVPN